MKAKVAVEAIRNVFVERLWRYLKRECVYLYAFDRIRATGWP
ncbi:MAG: hypothetical protein V4472_13220 [Pseudomonadota bacterium]